MAIQVATVTLVVGQAWLKQPSGERLPLKEGMTVSQGDEIVTGDGSTVRLQMAGSDPIYIGSEREFLFGSEVVHSDLGASDAALHGLDSATTGILSQLLGSGADVFTAIQSLRLLSDNHDGASTQRDAYASDPTERSTDNLIRLLDLLETTDSIADRAARIADPSRPLVEEFPHTVPNDGRLSSDRFDHQGPDNAPVVGRGLEAPSDFGLAPFPAAFAGISVGSITSDNTLNLRESRDLVLVAGRVSGDAKAGDTVMLSVGENVYQTVVASDGAWSVHVPGSALEQHGTVHAAVTASNGAASVTATASRDYDVDTNPPKVDIRIDRIDPAEGGDAIGKTMGEARFIISGTLDYEAGADITVSVKVNGKDHDAVLDGNGRWSISVTAAEFGTAGEVYAMATATDAAGNSASTSVTHDYALNTPPVAAGGTVQGVEDTALVLDWGRFNVSDDSPVAEQGIVITGLPADGVLQFNTAGPGQAAAWTRIELSEDRYEVSRADIEAGRLRFVPDAHESGWDGSAGSGVGDQQADYARISYRPSDGEFEGAEATLRVDIVPVADAPVVGLEVGATSTVEGAGASYGLGGGIVLSVVNGTYAATGLDGGRLLLPPFAANTGGNINPNDAMQGKADIIALVGDFDTLVAGRDGNAWQPLHGINGENRDYVFLSKPHDRYELTNATYNQGFLNGRLTDLDTGLSINLNNVKGLVYGDGHSVGGVAVDYQAGESYDLVALQVHAGLVDRDGSETLSGVTLTGIPEGVAIEGAQRLADGSWFVANADGLASLDLSLVLRVPAGTEPFTVTASASASEQGVATVAVGSAAAGIGGGSGVEVALAVDAIAGDGVINAAEAGAPAIAVSGTVTADVGTSTTVTVTVNGQEYTATVDALNGRWTAEVSTSDLLADSAVSVNATSTDAAGNSTTVSSAQGYSVDITAPRLSVSVDPITSDNVVNAAESGAPIGVTGKVAGEFNEGDAVTLTVNGVQYTATVDAGGLWTIAVAGSDLVRAGSLNVSVTTTDDAGNSTTVTAVHGYSVDTVAPELTVSVNPVTVDNTINAAEAGAATIAVTGTIAAEAGTSTAVMVTVNGQDYVASVDAASGTWTAEVSTSDLLADSSVAVSATSIDAAGNSTTVSSTHGYSIDTTAPDLTISVDSIASDNVINAAESGESVDVTGKVVGEFNVGDTVTLTVNSIEYAGTVAADGTWTMAVPGADLASANSLNVSVTTADDAGNSTTATAVHGYSTDTAAPELTVSVHPVTADNTINAAEAGAATIAVTGTIAAEAGTSTAVTITINGHEYTATVDTINGTWTADVATDDLLADSAVSVSATSTDVAGNRTTATAVHGYSVDTESPELEVSVDPITSDNVINAAESGVSIDVTGKVGGEFSEGDAVTLAVNGAEHIGTVDAAGLWTISVPGSELATVDALSVSVTTTDAAGNSTTATTTHGYGVDTTAPELTVSVDPITSDNVINAAEAGVATIAVTGMVVVEAGTSTAITVTVNGQEYTATVDAVAGTWTVDVATDDLLADSLVAASATSTDAAGNATTETVIRGYSVDTTAPELTVSVDSITPDNVINAAEAGGAVAVTGKVVGEFNAGDTATLTVNSKEYTGTVAADGTWTIAVPGADLVAANSLDVSVTTRDAAGNSTTATVSHAYDVDTTAPELTVSVNPVTADNTINAAEAGELTIAVTGTIAAEAGTSTTVTLTVNGQEYVANIDSVSGTWAVDVRTSDLLADGSVAVSATSTDTAGNSTTAVSSHSYSVDVTAPEVSVSVDPITSDNVINAAESNTSVDVTGSVTGEFNEGDAVTLVVNGSQYTGTVNAAGLWEISVAGSDLAASSSLNVSVTTTDSAGNSTTASAAHGYSVDIVAPELTVTMHPVTADNTINAAEAGASTIAVSGTVTAEVGASTTVTVTVNAHEYTATVDAATGTWAVDVATSDLLADSTVAVSATSIDAAGNATAIAATRDYSIDTVAPELTVTVDSITADNVINAAESGAETIAVTGTVAAEDSASAAVTVTVNGQEYAATVDVAAGTWTVDVATGDLLAGDAVLVSATSTDAAGNSTTVSDTHSYSVDTAAPELTVSVDPITSDNVINAAESGAETIAVTGAVAVEAGTSTTITVVVNSQQYTATVDAASGTWAVDVVTSDLLADSSVAVSATSTDAAGNTMTTTTTHGYSVDTTAPELAVSVNPITSDNVINAAESGGSVNVTGKVADEFNAGDAVTLTVNDAEYSGAVAADGTWTIAVQGSDLAAAASLNVSITTADAAGNATTTAVTHSYGVDTTAPELTVSVDSITADNVINAAEAGASVDVTGRVAGEFNEGDTVTLAVNGIEYIGAVDADGRWMIPVVGSDLAAAGSLSVSVTTTDAAGNSTTAAAVHGYSVDTVAPELTVSVNPVTADNTINAAEAGESTIAVAGTIAAEADTSTAVMVTVNGQDYVASVDAANGTWVVDVATDDLLADSTVSVIVTSTDAAGNSTTVSSTHSYSVDTTAPELAVSVNPITSDNIVSAAESGASIDVTGSVTGEFNEGDAITLTVNSTEYVGTVTAGGTWTIAVQGSDLAAAGSLNVSVTTTDVAGNSTTVTAVHGYDVDTVAPELTVSVDPVTADNTINAAESGESTIAVTGTIVAEAGTSTTVTITVNGQEYAASVDVINGTWTAEVRADDLLADNAVAVNATSTDAAGNSTAVSNTHGYSIDVAAPELAISVDSITPDNVINAAEAGASVDVTGKVTGEFNEGDTVTLTVGGAQYAGTVDAQGLWTIAVAGSDLAAADSLNASVTTTDAAGNSTTSSSTHGYGVDTEAPELTILVDSITSDNVVNAAEAGAPTIAVSGTVVAETGTSTTVTVTVNGQQYTATVDAAAGTWTADVATGDLLVGSSMAVSATSTDAAGNATTETTTHSYGVDTTAPELTVSVDSITPDNVVNAAESNTSIDVTGSVAGEFNAGDTVTLTVNNTEHAGTVAADGTWAIAVPGADLASANSLNVSVTTADAAGNGTTAVAVHAYSVDTVAPELTVSVNPVTVDNIINVAESGESTIAVTGTIATEADASTAVTVAVNGQEYAASVDSANGTWTVDVLTSDLLADNAVAVSAASTDATGNSTTATTTHSYGVDMTAPELTVSVDPITSDNVINAAESGDASIAVTGTFVAEDGASTTVTITVNGQQYTATVDAVAGTWTTDVATSDLLADSSVTVSATSTDAAGNATTETAIRGYSVDTTAPELTVSVDSITPDNVINAAEAGGAVAVTGKVVGEFNAGDTATLTVNSNEYTGTVAADGTWTIAVAGSDLAAADSLNVSVTATDAAGNSTTAITTHSYGVDTIAPELAVSVDAITSDNVINAAEASESTIAVTGTIAAEAGASTTVTITVNGQEYVANIDSVSGTWAVDVRTSDLLADSAVSVSAASTDVAGNSTMATATHHYGVDIMAPEVSVSVDPITSDNVINVAESGAPIDVTGKVTGEFNEGDVVTLTVNSTEYAGTVAADGTWTIAVPGADLVAANSLDVSVTTTDAADNSTTATVSHAYGVDTTAPELTVSVDSITSDNVINAAESGAASIAVTGTVIAEAGISTTVTVTVNGQEYTAIVDAAAGIWTVDVATSDLLADGSVAVSATSTDAAGNATTATTTHSYGVDTTAPELTVSVNPVTVDNTINAAEADVPTIAVTGTIAAEAGTSTTVTVTVNGREYAASVDAAAGTWTVDVVTGDLLADNSVAVSVTSTDAAGNATTTTTTHGYSVDTTAPELMVSIDPITSDNVVNAAESDTSINVTGMVAGEFNEGDAVILMVNDSQYTGTVDAAGLWTISVPGSELATVDALSVSVTATDAAGNSTTATAVRSYGVDVTAPELTVSVNPVTADNTINAAESGESTIAVTGTIVAEAGTSTTVTVTVNGQEYVASLDAVDGTWTVDVLTSDLLADSAVSVSASSVDVAGNATTTTAVQAYGIDITAPELTALVDPVTSDNVINAAEAGAEAIAVTGTVFAEADTSTTVTVTVNGQQYTATVDAVSGTWSADIATSDLLADSLVAVSATSTDAAGNSTTTSATHNYSIDTQAPELAVSVDPITPDNVINVAEAGASVDVTGKVTGEFNEGDTVTLTVGDAQYAGTVDAEGLWTISVSGSDLAATDSLDVSVKTTDAAGNSTTATAVHGYSVDTAAPELTVSVNPVTADNTINAAEAGATTIAVAGTIVAEAGTSTTVNITVNGQQYTATVDAINGTWTAEVATGDLLADNAVAVSATSSDAAGNSMTVSSTHSYSVDTTAPELTVSVDSITPDNVINAAEAGGAVDVIGKVVGEFNTGDTVTLTVNDTEYSGAVGEDGTWTITVAGSDLAAADSLNVSATTADAAGNSTTAITTHGYSVDTTAPELTVSVDPVTSDNVINAAESGAETIAVTGAVAAEAGTSTTVTVTVNGQQYTATVDAASGTWAVDVATSDLLADSSVAVSATSTDAAGNATTETTTHSYGVDTTAPELTVSVDSITPDNVVNAAESNALVDVTGSVAGEFNAGDTVTLTVNGTEYRGTVDAEGLWTVAVAGSELVAANSLNVSVTTADAAGNSTTASAVHAYSVDTVAPELTVSVNPVTVDNIINIVEAGESTIAVTGAIAAEAGTSTTITVVVNSQQYTATVDAASGTWAVDVATSDLLADSSVAVSATSTDAAGNTTTTTITHGYSVDTTAPELAVSVSPITSDNVINAAESGGSVNVTGKVADEFNAGDAVTLTINDAEYSGAVAADGTWTIAVQGSDLAAATSLNVSITTADAAGNATTTAVTHSYGVDTIAPELTVSVDPITSDNVINAAESGAAVIAVAGSVAAEAGTSTTVTITVNGQEYTASVDAVNGTWSVEVATGDLLADNAVAVNATSTDAAGNSTMATTTHSYGVDIMAPEVSVFVDPITPDNVINAAESSLSIDVTGKVTGEFNEGDAVTLMVNGIQYTGTVNAAGLWAISVAGSDLAASSSLNVSVTTTDPAGNSTIANAAHGYSVDTVVPELTVSVDPVTADNTINAAESGESTIAVTGTIAAEAGASTTVTLTVNGQEYVASVDAVRGTWAVDVQTSDLLVDSAVSVSATSTDAAGNSTTVSSSHSYSVDITAPELALTVDPITSDNVVNAAESGAETVAVTGTVVAEDGASTAVTVTVNGQQYTATVDAAAGTWTTDIATSDLLADSSVAVSATSTDAAGNSTMTSSTHGYSVDIAMPELTVSIDSITLDNVINAAEVGESIDVTGKVTGEFSEGDVVTLTVNGIRYTGAVDEEGSWTISVPGSELATVDALSVSVTTTDAAGNSTTVTAVHGYSVDAVAPELTVSVNPVTADNTVNAAEAGESTIAVTGTIALEAGVSATVTVTVNGQDYVASVDAVSGTWTAEVSTSDLLADNAVAVTATSTDAAGNSTTVSSTHGYSVDTTAPEVSVSVNTITSDNVVNAAEAGAATIAVTGTVAVEAGTSTTVTVTVNGQQYAATVDAAAGTWTTDVATSDLLADNSVAVSAVSSDAAGNSTTTTATHGYGVDTTPPELVVTIDPISGDGYLDRGEAASAVTVTGRVSGEVTADTAVRVTVGGHVYEATLSPDGSWSVPVAGEHLAAADSIQATATATDAAGNSASDSATQSYEVQPPNEVPVAAGGTVQGVEDTALVLDWSRFNVSDDSPAAEQGIVITGLPADGVLQFNTAGPGQASAWTRIELSEGRYEVSRADIEAGRLRFVPDAHESGWDGSAGSGVGDQQADYARISYRPSDGEFEGAEATLRVDIVPVADAPVVGLEVGATSTVEGAGASYGLGGGIVLSVVNGTYAATGLDGGRLLLPPFADKNINPNDVTRGKTDIIALVGDFDGLMAGGQRLHLINGDVGRDYVYLSKDHEQYVLSNVNTHDGRINATVTDLATGESVQLVNVKGLVYGDGHSVGGVAVDYQAGESYDLVALQVHAGLVDRDGSETLSGVTLTGIPEGVAIEGAQRLADGSWFVANADGLASLDLSLVLRVPAGTEPFTVTASASASEQGVATVAVGSAAAGIGGGSGVEVALAVDAIAGDGIINAAEAGAPAIAVSGTVTADVGTSTTVTVTVNGQEYTATVDALNGRWTAEVSTSDLLADSAVSVNATSTDAAGNATTTTAVQGYAVDTTPPELVVTIDPISGDGYLDRGEAASTVTVTGRVSGEVTADTAVRVTVGGHVYEATLSPDGSWSVPVAGEHLAAAGSIQATATATDAAGNSASDSATQSYVVQPPNEVPVAADGAVQGVEDTALVLDWGRFNVSDDSPAAEQGIVITGLPADGVLQFNTAVSGSVAVWTQVELAGGEYQVSRADIEAGRLRFVPDDHESGGDAYGGSGVGDQQADYARIVFRPTDGENTGEEATLRIGIAPVADAPEVNVTLARIETDSGPAVGSEIVQVNGGSGVPGGFDVQDGKIVKIGEGVRVWLTEGDAAPEAANPAEQIRYYTQGNQGGDANYADIYVVHSQSGWFYRQSDWAPDRKELRKLDSVGGNRESNADGDKDYIFVQREDGYSYSASHSTNNNDATHVNTLDGVRVSYTGPGGSGSLISQVSNNLEGVIFGNGSPAHLADSSGTTFETVAPSSGVEVSYEIAISAAVTDTDGSEFLGDLLLAGIPAGAAVSAAGALPEGLSLVQAGQDWALRWDAGAAGEARQAVDVVLEVRGVPEDAAFNGVTVSTEAHEANGSVASASGSAVLGQGDPADPGAGSEPEAPGVPGDDGGDPGTGGEDGEGGGPVGDIPHSGTDLLVNGDFSQLANANEYGWSGNNDQGYTAWTHTGPFLESTWRMTGSSHSIEDGGPYVGAWNNDARDITLSQHVSGVPAGSVLQLDVAWNNPNNGIPGDPWNAPKDTGNGMRLEISFGGVVYAVIATPEAGVPVDQAGFATVTAMNGAAVSIDRIETWSHDYSTDHGNDDFHPRGLTGFQTLQIQLPADAPETGSLTLHWDPQSEGSQYTDDLMVANLHLYAGDGTVQPLSSPLVDGGLPPEAGAPGGDGSQPPAGADEDGEDGQSAMHVLAGTPGNDVFEWSLGDGGVTHDVIRDFGTGEDGRGRDVLDLRDLLDGEQNGELTQYLHFSTALNDQGQADTVIHVQTQGGLAADGSGYNHQITIENVDLVGAATDQAQLIQNLIQEGRLRVDQ